MSSKLRRKIKQKAPKHTRCRRGNDVFIKKRNGEVIEDKYIERKQGTIFLKNYGRIQKKEIELFRVTTKYKKQKI